MVSWSWTAARKAIEEQTPGSTFRFNETFYLWRPGASEAEVRLAYSTDDPDTRRKTTIMDILNELGAEGWELVTSVVTKSTVGPMDGWETAGYPITRGWTLKRPVSDG